MLQAKIPFGTQRSKTSKGVFRLEDVLSSQHPFHNLTYYDLRMPNLPSLLDKHWVQTMSSAAAASG